MRKEYGQALRTLFAAEMRRVAPHFEAVRVKSRYFWPGDRAYRWRATERLHGWVVLSPSRKDYDAFTILIGWSRHARYPELNMVPCAELPTSSRDEFARDEYLTRLPYLWGQEDRWWVIREFDLRLTVAELEASLQPIPDVEAKASVAPGVVEAVSRIQTVGIPYLEELVRIETGVSAKKLTMV
jgi:hypothetical protein